MKFLATIPHADHLAPRSCLMMISKIMTCAVLLTSLVATSRAEQTPSETAATPARVPVDFQKLYTPHGFDSNDNVQIVGEGRFDHACYRPTETKVQVDETKKIITVGPAAFLYHGWCLQVTLPFHRVMNLGIVSPGDYQIVQSTDHKVLGHIVIKAAMKLTPDDYLYAPIEQAYLRDQQSRTKVLLSGNFANSCMKLVEVKSQIQKNMIVLQPIAEMQTLANCTDGEFAFEKEVDLGSIPEGRYLLHVRSMNGNAINSLVNVKH